MHPNAPKVPKLPSVDVRAVQQFLNSHGFNVGRADGILGPKTVAALQRYLKSNGYPDIRPDGIYGPASRRAYEDAKAKGMFRAGGRRGGGGIATAGRTPSPTRTPPPSRGGAQTEAEVLAASGFSTTLELQQFLIGQGIDVGRPDGIFGNKTRRGFQQAEQQRLFVRPEDKQRGQTPAATGGQQGRDHHPPLPTPQPQDFVVAIVFPDQPIQAATESGIRDALPDWMEEAALDALELFGAKRTDSGSIKADFLGHAAVAFANGRTGLTRYWEYGRYDAAARGICRNIRVPDLKITPDFEATPDSLNKLFAKVSGTSGANTRVSAVLCRVPLGTHTKLEAYCQRVDQATKNKTAEEYAVLSNSCLHFMRRVMEEAGIDTPRIWDPRPASYISALQDRFTPLHWPDQNRGNG